MPELCDPCQGILIHCMFDRYDDSLIVTALDLAQIEPGRRRDFDQSSHWQGRGPNAGLEFETAAFEDFDDRLAHRSAR